MTVNYLRSTIIALGKTFLLMMCFFLLATLLIPSTNLIKNFIQSHKISLILLHFTFYLALYYCWPKLVNLIINRNQYQIAEEQINVALKAKWYFLSILLFVEILVNWRLI